MYRIRKGKHGSEVGVGYLGADLSLENVEESVLNVRQFGVAVYHPVHAGRLTVSLDSEAVTDDSAGQHVANDGPVLQLRKPANLEHFITDTPNCKRENK